MIHHVVYCQLEDEVSQSMVEDLVRWSRTLLLKIPEVLAVRSGRNLDPHSRWQFFFAIEVDSLEKLKATLEDPFHLKLMETYIKPATKDFQILDFELDPSKDLKYS